MIRICTVMLLTLVGWVSLASSAQADVFVRAPFVRVYVGPEVYVRAPFVRLWIPIAPPPLVGEALPPPRIAPPLDPQAIPPKVGNGAPPMIPANQGMRLDDFVKTFEPKGGTYEVDLLNPVTGMPTKVRFALPEGTPRQTFLRAREIEFYYGPNQFVRIQFDRQGAMVISR